MKKVLIGLLIVSILLVSGIGSCNSNQKLQICPDSWTDNQMPCVYKISPSECGNRESFVVNGEKRNSSEFDLDWIKQNCEIRQPSVAF